MLIEDFEKFTEENGLKKREEESIFPRRTAGIFIDDVDDNTVIDLEDNEPTTGMLEAPEEYNCLVGDITCPEDGNEYDEEPFTGTPPQPLN